MDHDVQEITDRLSHIRLPSSSILETHEEDESSSGSSPLQSPIASRDFFTRFSPASHHSSRNQTLFKTSAPLLLKEDRGLVLLKSPSFVTQPDELIAPTTFDMNKNFSSASEVEQSPPNNQSSSPGTSFIREAHPKDIRPIKPNKKSVLYDSTVLNAYGQRQQFSTAGRVTKTARNSNGISSKVSSNSTMRMPESSSSILTAQTSDSGLLLDSSQLRLAKEKKRHERRKSSNTSSIHAFNSTHTIANSSVFASKTSGLLQIPEDMSSQDLLKYESSNKARLKNDKITKAIANAHAQVHLDSNSSFGLYNTLSPCLDTSFMKIPVHQVLVDNFDLSQGDLLRGGKKKRETSKLKSKMGKKKTSSVWEKIKIVFGKKE